MDRSLFFTTIWGKYVFLFFKHQTVARRHHDHPPWPLRSRKGHHGSGVVVFLPMRDPMYVSPTWKLHKSKQNSWNGQSTVPWHILDWTYSLSSLYYKAYAEEVQLGAGWPCLRVMVAVGAVLPGCPRPTRQRAYTFLLQGAKVTGKDNISVGDSGCLWPR